MVIATISNLIKTKYFADLVNIYKVLRLKLYTILNL